jgi:hypothetical protein
VHLESLLEDFVGQPFDGHLNVSDVGILKGYAFRIVGSL